MTIQLPDLKQAKTETCAADGCYSKFDRDQSHRFGVGISHYHLDENGKLTRSYAQVFTTLHSCSRECALAAIKARIDQHASIPFGIYNASIHNPAGAISEAEARMHVEYNDVAILPLAAMPKKDALTGADLSNAKDWYLPHVDDSTRGMTYQEILRKQYPGATYEQLTLGCGTLSGAMQLAHAILDEIIEPDYQASQPVAEAEA